jgi:adenylate cyclase
MTDYSREETAVRGRVDLAYVTRLVELGMLRPAPGDRFTAGDARRATVIHTLAESGIPLEGMADALQRGAISLDFLDSAVYERFATYANETYAQLSQRTGVPMELLRVIREAMGAPTPNADDPVREDELAVLPFIQIQLQGGFDPAAIEGYLRVQGDSLRRMARAEGDWWRTQVAEPALAAGRTPEAIAASEFSVTMAAAAERSLLTIWHAHQAHAWTENILAGFEQLLAGAGLYRRVERPPAMCFLDITGYTRLTQQRGDEAAAELAARLARLVERSSLAHGGRPVKWLGDGVMFHFRDPGHAVEAALEMAEGVVDAGLPPAHVGIHAGPVIFQEGDYYGQTVNVAARIADYARPGEVLVTEVVAAASGDSPVAFSEIGPVELKGVEGATLLLAARRA